MATADLALELASKGYYIFPIRVTQSKENPYKFVKTPLTKHGHLDATRDPGLISDWFAEKPGARIGVATGKSGIVVLDVDVKRDPDGNVVGDGFETIEWEWLDVPRTFSYTSSSGMGTQYVYSQPEGVTLSGVSDYRGYANVDRRAGSSWVAWNSEEAPDKSSLAAPPEWLLDETTLRTLNRFEGTVKEWFDALEPGEPNLLVRKAIERAEELFSSRGDDLSHSEMVGLQHNAIRLGAEGNPGVVKLLETLEELWLSRDPAGHSTPESSWEYKFQEALASGIEKHGESIQLLKELPEYNISMVPGTVPSSLLTAAPSRDAFRELLSALVKSGMDPLSVTSVLWGAPSTRDLSREWGLEFVHLRVTEAQVRPEPTRENPTLERLESPELAQNTEFLSEEELSIVKSNRTFIDDYCDAAAARGFIHRNFAIPAAWTALSMACGHQAYIPKGVPVGMNLWFIGVGPSGSGKSSEYDFLKAVLDTVLKDEEGYYNLGAMSSPEALHVGLLERSGEPSMILHDEASDFFEALHKKDYMSTLKDSFSKWYMGVVDPQTKISLKELRGKSGTTSFHLYMLGTPDRLLSFIDTSMFASGFMARVNWIWAPPHPETDEKYISRLGETDSEGRSPEAIQIAEDLLRLRAGIHAEKPIPILASDEALDRLDDAFRRFDKAAKLHERYDVLEPAIIRLGRETIWKCAALLTLHRGGFRIELTDALTAIYYAQDWYYTLLEVVSMTSEGEFSRDVAMIEDFIRDQGGSVTLAKLTHRFRGLIKTTSRELSDRIDFLVRSGRVNQVQDDRTIRYVLNGGA